MNKFFIQKVSKLKTDKTIDPVEALADLKDFLKDKNVKKSGFKLNELNDSQILKLIKSMKGKKSSGVDWICGYSLKIAAKDLN